MSTDAAFAARGIETAEQRWDALATEPAFASLLTDRTARFVGKQRQESPPGFDVHVAALRDAGFREVATIWQKLSNRVLLAVRRCALGISRTQRSGLAYVPVPLLPGFLTWSVRGPYGTRRRGSF